MNCCVIGSGPAAVACAHALLERGSNVTMLDAGISLESSRAELVAQMRGTSPDRWTEKQIAQLKEGTEVGTKGIPLKLLYGSDFPYREQETHAPADFEHVGIRPSFARGGLSNVWGATMMPYRAEDIADWPITASDLARHYAAVLQFTPLSARKDNLEQFFPIYLENPPALELSEQSRILLEKLESNRAELSQSGIFFGQARVAIKVARQDSPGCVYCGLCMFGCPYGYIYNSDTTLEQLKRNPNFTYQPGIIVTNFRETNQKIVAEGYRRDNRENVAIETDRAFLAAGVIPSAQILLRSMHAFGETIRMRDSQYFLVPLLLMRRARNVRREALHALSQIFLEIFEPQISPHTIHLQVYSYNDLIGQAVRQKFGPLAGPLKFLASQLEDRLLVVQGYLHSAQSSNIAVTLKADGRLNLRAEINPQTKPTIRKIISKLFRYSRQLGAVPLSPMLQIAEAGRGFHSGGTFPMRTQPGKFETDVLGRPQNWKRLHVVDATVLPTIPSTTITFSVMANAHRIGAAALK